MAFVALFAGDLFGRVINHITAFAHSFRSNSAVQPMPCPSYGLRAAAVEGDVKAAKALSEFVQLSTLGEGAFGRVLLVRHDPSGKLAALKQMKKKTVIVQHESEHVLSERRILMDTVCPFVVELYCAFQDFTNLYLCFEYMPGGELASQMRPDVGFTEMAARFYASQVVLAVEYFQAHQIMHRDIKPENLLFSANGYIKVADFGFAKRVGDRTWTVCGTPEYLAPEIVAEVVRMQHGQTRGAGYSHTVDWWSVGVVIFEMLTGCVPFAGENSQLFTAILNHEVVVPAGLSSDVADLLQRLLCKTPSVRTWIEADGSIGIKRHPWFAPLDWDAIAAGTVAPPYIPSEGAVPPMGCAVAGGELPGSSFRTEWLDVFREFG